MPRWPNASTGRSERVSRIYEVHADKRRERDGLEAGDIAALVGLKETLTGHTLADKAHPQLLDCRVSEANPPPPPQKNPTARSSLRS